MDMPKPTEHHRKYQASVGNWTKWIPFLDGTYKRIAT